MDFEEIIQHIAGGIFPLRKRDCRELFCGFEKRFMTLQSNGMFENLLRKFTQDNVDINLVDFITEFNLAYEILQLHKNASIEYEPIRKGKIDFVVNLLNDSNLCFDIQVKRISKSYEYDAKKQLEEYEGSFIPINPIDQLERGLEKAASKRKNILDNNIFLIVQEVTESSDVDKIAISETLYGREIWKITRNKAVCIGRKKDIENIYEEGGFFFTQIGRTVDGYMELRRTGETLFGNYEKTLYLNPVSEDKEHHILSFIPCGKVYTYKDIVD